MADECTKPSVSVILSTYNGEKYINELLESVLNQRDVDVKVVIRDDGSKDSTLDIVKERNDSRIKIYTGENMGPAKSFMKAIQLTEDTDYYAYCDQDDVWYLDKLIHGVNKLRNSNDSKPALYMSTYDVVDKELNVLHVRNMEYEKPFTLSQTILFRSPSGCTMIYNKALRDILIKTIPEHIRMHDFWTLLTIEAVHGDIYTENYSSIKYRQHESNTVGCVPSFSLRMKRLVNSVLHDKNERSLQAKSLYDCYKDILPMDSKEKILEVVNYKKSIKNRFCLLIDKDFRWDSYINSLFYISVILGVF